ncbi:FAD-binding protein [Candidatus Spongiihabitans sp.]|uniref:FAD-binding protein n=1 Tax=Candidatus Spongiihabitans sp. TaxID=3101308 RepID=UPI003C7C1268
MKTDAIIIGSEFDGLIAATRLDECGYSIRMFSNGVGSLHYAPEGIHVLGYTSSCSEQIVTAPLAEISHLDKRHPYQKVGVQQVKNAFNWYENIIGEIHQRVAINGSNKLAVSAAGLCIPVYGTFNHQATMEKISGKTVAIARLRDYRNFPADLIAVGLGNSGINNSIFDIDAPSKILENTVIAKAFDALDELDGYFSAIKESVPTQTEVILFPAIMGMSRNSEVLAAAERVLEVPCLEVPTLPPSVPGMRLEHAFTHHLQNSCTAFHLGGYPGRRWFVEGNQIVIYDDLGRRFEASVVIVSSGGVFMGGLDVDSYGLVHETAFGFHAFQSEPLNAATVDQSLNALHVAGVETDNALRPQRKESGVWHNAFVTGRTLAHWNPAMESSTEGVCIATGWAAAENAQVYLETISNG